MPKSADCVIWFEKLLFQLRALQKIDIKRCKVEKQGICVFFLLFTVPSIHSVKRYEDLMKIREKSGKTRKPDKFPEKKITLSYMRSKPSILYRNVLKTALIWRFENCPLKKKLKKKEIFKLWSFAYEVKTVNMSWTLYLCI